MSPDPENAVLAIPLETLRRHIDTYNAGHGGVSEAGQLRFLLAAIAVEAGRHHPTPDAPPRPDH